MDPYPPLLKHGAPQVGPQKGLDTHDVRLDEIEGLPLRLYPPTRQSCADDGL